MLKHRTEAVIADLVDAAYGGQRGPGGRRKRHVMRQALYALVRLAKVEQLMEMRLDAEQATGGMIGAGQRRHTKALLRKIAMDVHAEWHRLEQDWATARAVAGNQADVEKADVESAGIENVNVENDCGKP